MSKQKLEIHSENILPIIKKWLYSDKDIFVRELVSNACDAIHKVKICEIKAYQANDDEFKIEIQINKEKTLTLLTMASAWMPKKSKNISPRSPFLAQKSFRKI